MYAVMPARFPLEDRHVAGNATVAVVAVFVRSYGARPKVI